MNTLQAMTGIILAMFIVAGINNFIEALDVEDYERVAKWAILTILFGISLIVSLFA